MIDFVFKHVGGNVYRQYDGYDFGNIDIAGGQSVYADFVLYTNGFTKKLIDVGMYFGATDASSNNLSIIAAINEEYKYQYGLHVEQSYEIYGQSTESSSVDTEIIDAFFSERNIPFVVHDPLHLVNTTLAIVDGVGNAKTNAVNVSAVVGYNDADRIKHRLVLSSGLVDINTSLSYVPQQNDLYKVVGTARHYVDYSTGISPATKIKLAANNGEIDSPNNSFDIRIGFDAPLTSFIGDVLDPDRFFEFDIFFDYLEA